MAIITSADTLASANVTITQDPDGVYSISVSSLAPNQTLFAISIGGTRIWQGQARTDDQGGA